MPIVVRIPLLDLLRWDRPLFAFSSFEQVVIATRSSIGDPFLCIKVSSQLRRGIAAERDSLMSSSGGYRTSLSFPFGSLRPVPSFVGSNGLPTAFQKLSMLARLHGSRRHGHTHASSISLRPSSSVAKTSNGSSLMNNQLSQQLDDPIEGEQLTYRRGFSDTWPTVESVSSRTMRCLDRHHRTHHHTVVLSAVSDVPNTRLVEQDRRTYPAFPAV